MSTPTNRTALLKVWRAYYDHRRSEIASTTVVDDYAKVTARLERMPPWVESAEGFLEWMETETKPNGKTRWSKETIRRTLMQIKAACKWAKRQGMLRQDPFAEVENRKRQRRGTGLYRAFTADERTIILNTAQELEPRHRRWIQAMFFTGCRPSELRALKRSHWASDGSVLQIVTAYPMRADGIQGTKTGRTTPDYPVNRQLAVLLKEASAGASKTDWLFKGLAGGPFDYQNFQADVFGPLVNQLAEQGKIAFPMTQYHARHTWITEALHNADPSKRMSVQDVAYLCRTSPEIIMKHYAQRSRNLSIPEM